MGTATGRAPAAKAKPFFVVHEPYVSGEYGIGVLSSIRLGLSTVKRPDAQRATQALQHIDAIRKIVLAQHERFAAAAV